MHGGPQAGQLVDVVVDALVQGKLSADQKELVNLHVSGPSLSVSDQSSYYTQALKLAVVDAKSQAQAIADAAGLNLGGILHITNEGSSRITNQDG